MISAYIDNAKPCSCKSLAVYAEGSTLAKGGKEVRDFINQYLSKNKCSDDVRKFLQGYANNLAALNKTHVVCDGSFRNLVILVRPDGIVRTGYFPTDIHDVYEYLEFCIKNAETIFLNMTDETWKDVNAWMDYMDDLLDF